MKKVLIILFLILLNGCDDGKDGKDGKNGIAGITGLTGEKGCDIDQKWDDEAKMCILNTDFEYPKDGTDGYEELLKVAAEECKKRFPNDFIRVEEIISPKSQVLLFHCVRTPNN